jgi:hypothetical protein
MTPQYILINDLGNKFYYKDKEMTIFHREDGPAYEGSNGTKKWYLNGELHREDGPAVEWFDGSEEWWLNNELHREDGPAVEYVNGSKVWYLDGVEYTEEGFKKKTAKEVVLTIDEIADKLGIKEGTKLVIVKGASDVGMTMQEAWG